MAKVKEVKKEIKKPKAKVQKDKDFRDKIKPWLENKMAAARKVSKPRAARAVGRFGAPAAVTLLAFFIIYSLFLPKDQFQLAKERLLKNPDDFEAHLLLAEAYLSHNQVEEAEKELLLAQKYPSPIISSDKESQVLGEESSLKWERLWQRKTQAKPEDIKRLIKAWEAIIARRNNYRDGYFQLAILHYKLFENQEAKKYLDKVLELDPNFEPAQKLANLL